VNALFSATADAAQHHLAVEGPKDNQPKFNCTKLARWLSIPHLACMQKNALLTIYAHDARAVPDESLTCPQNIPETDAQADLLYYLPHCQL
jgi:hypothetical protein